MTEYVKRLEPLEPQMIKGFSLFFKILGFILFCRKQRKHTIKEPKRLFFINGGPGGIVLLGRVERQFRILRLCFHHNAK